MNGQLALLIPSFWSKEKDLQNQRSSVYSEMGNAPFFSSIRHSSRIKMSAHINKLEYYWGIQNQSAGLWFFHSCLKNHMQMAFTNYYTNVQLQYTYLPRKLRLVVFPLSYLVHDSILFPLSPPGKYNWNFVICSQSMLNHILFQTTCRANSYCPVRLKS